MRQDNNPLFFAINTNLSSRNWGWCAILCTWQKKSIPNHFCHKRSTHLGQNDMSPFAFHVEARVLLQPLAEILQRWSLSTSNLRKQYDRSTFCHHQSHYNVNCDFKDLYLFARVSVHDGHILFSGQVLQVQFVGVELLLLARVRVEGAWVPLRRVPVMIRGGGLRRRVVGVQVEPLVDVPATRRIVRFVQTRDARRTCRNKTLNLATPFERRFQQQTILSC